ncbi:MAG: 23S rRNA (uridine(2552)-2'-O)-methyltransferase RlmE [Proteobacteria bacterium]|nr:23S rRNA (uridine(2552)-2'-O)-methyltransferase RlmE [Pseudomonadota bacterium]
MASTKHGKSWISRHINDPFVQKAQKLGYRSRATFKLLELHQKDKLFKPNMTVIDLGAAPGGWSQILVNLVGKNGKVIALDRLEMAPIPGVTFLQGDFSEQAVLENLESLVGPEKVDWVVSDMSPNLSGVLAVDQPRIMILADLALYFAMQHLKKGGGFLTKVFQGEDFDLYIKKVRQCFEKVVIRKPDASRSASRELYVLARGYYNI